MGPAACRAHSPRHQRAVLGGADLPRADLRHLRHRPRHPDRPGARHRRRQGVGSRRMTGCASRSASTCRSPCSTGAIWSRCCTAISATPCITSHPVLQDMLRVFPATMELSMLALFIGVVFGIPLGVIAATHRGRWPDQVIRFGSLLGYSMPVFWLGLVGLLGVLRQARLGRGAGAARRRLRRHRAAGHRPDHRRQPDRRRERRVLERAQPSGAAGLDPGLFLARLCRAHDPQLHARPAQAGIHRWRRWPRGCRRSAWCGCTRSATSGCSWSP